MLSVEKISSNILLDDRKIIWYLLEYHDYWYCKDSDAYITLWYIKAFRLGKSNKNGNYNWYK